LNLIVYPRGFIGFDNGQSAVVPKQMDYADLVKNIVYNRPTDDNQVNNPFNPEVSTLWREYVSGAGRISSFDFRERILKAALNAFGTNNFQQWCELQVSNPYFSATHVKFMNDTFGYLDTGVRGVNVQSWRNIVAIGSPGDNSKSVYKMREFFRLDEKQPYAIKESNLLPFINTWVSYEGGFSDLLNTLAIFFGDI
jgi:hypothetical protein